MNLRHSKPSHSYSESAPSPKLSEIRIKQDPMLRYHAQALVNFMQRANLKFQIHQEKLRLSRSKNRKKSKGKKQPKKKENKTSARGTKKQRQNTTPIKDKMKGRQIKKIDKPVFHEQIQEKKVKENEFEFPPDFLDMLLTLCGQFESDQQTGTQLSNNITSNLQYMCSIHPEYVPLLTQLYCQDYYIEGFHPSQLTMPD